MHGKGVVGRRISGHTQGVRGIMKGQNSTAWAKSLLQYFA